MISYDENKAYPMIEYMYRNIKTKLKIAHDFMVDYEENVAYPIGICLKAWKSPFGKKVYGRYELMY